MTITTVTVYVPNATVPELFLSMITHTQRERRRGCATFPRQRTAWQPAPASSRLARAVGATG